MIFSHWQLMNGDPLDENSQAQEIIMGIRKRKGLKQEMPDFNDYYDKVSPASSSCASFALRYSIGVLIPILLSCAALKRKPPSLVRLLLTRKFVFALIIPRPPHALAAAGQKLIVSRGTRERSETLS